MSKATKILLFLSLFLLGITPAYATLSVSVSGGNWAAGHLQGGAQTSTSGDTWTVTNEGDVYEDIYIKVDGTTWHPGSSAGAETFVLKYDTTGSWSDPITNTDNGIVLVNYVEASQTQTFDLQFTAPTSSTVEDIEQTLTVTLTAVAGTHTCGTSLTYNGKTYNTVANGSQCWFVENLDYNDGCSSETWVDATDVGWCGYYTGGPYTNEGLLYQWSAAMDGSTTEGAQGLCPLGWHIPTDAEFHTLEDAYDSGTCSAVRTDWGCDPAGSHLSTLTSSGDNSSGFTALLIGYRFTDGTFVWRSNYEYFWSSTESSAEAWVYKLSSSSSEVYRNTYSKPHGASVRCIKD